MHARFTKSLNIIASHSDGGAEVKRVGKILRDAGFLCLIYPVNNIYCTEISSLSNKTQLNFIYYIELHVSIYLRSSSGSQLDFEGDMSFVNSRMT
jgi:hypothetical protein